jgi:phosphoglycerol transferase MdoB-like AlkP superfamily enzyme
MLMLTLCRHLVVLWLVVLAFSVQALRQSVRIDPLGLQLAHRRCFLLVQYLVVLWVAAPVVSVQ